MGRGVNLFRAPIRRARAEALFNRNGAKDADEVEDAGGYDRDQLEKDRAEVAALVKAAGLKNMGGGEWGRSYEAPVTVTLYGADWTIDRRGKSGEKTRLASDTGAAALRMKLALLD